MSEAKPSANSSSSALMAVFINVIIPVLILDFCSHGAINPLERLPDQKFYQIGPLWSIVIALMLPIFYGIRSIIIQKRFELLSAVGMAGVVLTGMISLFVIGRNGEVHAATPWLFAGKEALIPLILASAVLVSSRSSAPLLNTFIYNPDIFDINRIEKAVEQHDQSDAYEQLLARSTWTLAGALVLSSVANFFFSYHFMKPVLEFPVAEQQLEYNLAISRITWWGFLIIGVPLLGALFYILHNLIKKIGRMTKLSRNDILYL